MRALEPRHAGFATSPRDGVRSYYEVFGSDALSRTVLALPTWSLVHSRVWKMQVPFLVRAGFRVVSFDGRGNGRSDIPVSGYTMSDHTADAIAVLDQVGVECAALLAFSAGARWAAQLAALHAARVERVVMIAPSVSLAGSPRKGPSTFLAAPPDRDGWNKYNAVHWRENLPDFTRWFAEQIFSEPHSTKGPDDIVEWSGGTTAESLIATVLESGTPTMPELWPAIERPLLIVHGSDDHIMPLANSHELEAANPRVELLVMHGSGHAPQLRDPVRFNLALKEFLGRPWSPGLNDRAEPSVEKEVADARP